MLFGMALARRPLPGHVAKDLVDNVMQPLEGRAINTSQQGHVILWSGRGFCNLASGHENTVNFAQTGA